MEQYRLIHIHTNINFINDINMYLTPSISNHIVFIGEQVEKTISYFKESGISYQIFPKSEASILEIIKIAKDYNGFVLNDLDLFKTKLLMELPIHLKVFLRLFGGELYTLKQADFLSRKTQKYNYPIALSTPNLINLMKRIKDCYLVKRDAKNKMLLQKGIYERINAILLYNKFEYETLQRYFYLPPFLQLHLQTLTENYEPNKEKIIIFGNSRHIWNNHLDIIDELKDLENQDISIKCFFSYGGGTAYAQKVEEESKKIPLIELITYFLPREEFNEIYSTASALVINSYRQHALGNIFTALKSGCKIYLNKKSSTYQWLIDEGFIISEVSTLKRDINSNDYQLTLEEQEYNRKKYAAYQKKYSKDDFIMEVVKYLNPLKGL